MSNNEKILYTIVIITGLLLIWWIYVPNGEVSTAAFPDNMSITADPPKLSNLPFHLAFVDMETCLRCHGEGRQINLKGEIMEAPKIAHEVRDNCTTCHQIPKIM